jgi:hypothetical protein
MPKPFSIVELVQTVRETLKRSSRTVTVGFHPIASAFFPPYAPIMTIPNRKNPPNGKSHLTSPPAPVADVEKIGPVQTIKAPTAQLSDASKMDETKNVVSNRPAGEPLLAKNNADQTETNFTPFPEEIARRAYFSYVNEGSPQGCHVQHWLDAEAGLINERNRTRIHGFHN